MSKPKILEQIDNAGGVFAATYNTTTYQEIKDAYDSGKDIIVPYDGNIYELITIPTGNNILTFQKRQFNNNGYANTYYDYITITANSVWNRGNAFNSKIFTSIYSDSQTAITSSKGYYHPIRLSTEEPTASDGNIGDIWIQYEAD